MSNNALNEDITYNNESIYDPDADKLELEEPTEQPAQSTTSEENTASSETESEQAQNEQNQQSSLPKTVPYQRFQQKVHEANELSQKYRELELELARLQGAASTSNQNQPQAEPEKQQPPIDINKLRSELIDAQIEGELETATAIQKQIDQYNEKLIEQKALQIAERVIKEKEQAKLQEQQQATQAQNQQYAEEFLTKYDYLNDESANFDAEAFEIFSAFFKSSFESGTRDFKPSLDYAVSKVEALTNRSSTPAPTPVTPKKPTLTEQQIEEQLKRVQQATPQVANKGTTGNTPVVDISAMSEEEYERFRDNGGKFEFEQS